MDAGVLDVLHDAADHDARAVGDRVDVASNASSRNRSIEHRPLLRHAHGASAKYSRSDASSYTICIARPPSTYDGRTSTGYPMRCGDVERLVDARGRAVRRLREPELARDLLEPPPVLGDVDRVGRRAENLHARGLERPRELERRLPAELHDHALRLLALHDLEHVLERQRLEVQLVRGVEVGGDRLGVRVDHDRLEPLLAQRERGAHAAVVELDALPDAVRAAAEDHDRPRAAPRRLALFVVACRRDTASPTETRRRRCRPSCTPGARPAPSGARAPRAPSLAAQRAELPIGEAQALHAAHVVRASRSASAAYSRSASTSSRICCEEPRVDRRELVASRRPTARAPARA